MTHSFEVKEINLSGVVATTIYNGETEEDVVKLVRSKGHMPININRVSTKSTEIDIKLFDAKLKTKDLSILCRQMSAMLYAGMPLLDSLEVIKEQTTNKRLARIMAEVSDQVQKGEMLSTALKRHNNDFPPILISMVAAGEMTGKIDDALAKLATHFAKEHRIQQKIKGAMIYPAIIGIIALAAVVILLNVVMPTFVDMFDQVGAELPKLTQILLSISGFTTQYWYVVVLVMIFTMFLITRFLSTETGKNFMDNMALKIPVVKTATAQIATSRFTDTLATLLSSGISLLDALETAANVTNNTIIIKGISEVADDIKKGKNLSNLLREIKLFPKMLISMVKVGEESGALEDMLNRSAEFYEEELEEAIKRMTSVIEPMMIILMAIIIGFILVGMMLPMFEMFNTIK